jgi:hypothetical protein
MSDEQRAEVQPLQGVVRDASIYVTVENDHHMYIPDEYVGNPIVPNYYCRGWNGKEGREKYCGSRAGAGTDHSGFGRCGWHGGLSQTKHGMSRRYRPKSKRVDELVAMQDADPEPLNIIEDLKLKRAFLQEYLEQNESPEGEVVMRYTESIAKDTERVFNMRSKLAITYEQLKRFLFGVDRIVEGVIRKFVKDKTQAETIILAIREEIHALRP